VGEAEKLESEAGGTSTISPAAIIIADSN